jgi:integrase
MAKKIVLDILKFYTPSVIKKSSHKRNINEICDKELYLHPNDKFGGIEEFLFFPIILNNDGTIWAHGSRFLLYKIKSYSTKNTTTLNSLAHDLKDFKNFVEENEINYLEAKNKWTRPTVKFRNYLNLLEKEQKIKNTTIKRKIGTVCQFYEWLTEEEGIEFKTKMCIYKESFISFVGDKGLRYQKKIKSYDVAKISNTKNNLLIDDSIVDEGEILHPLEDEQIKIILNALLELNRYDIFLICLISLTTGARIQTIGTLRLKNFTKRIKDYEEEIPILCGYQTGIDTKKDKQAYLYFPTWVYKKVQVYIESEISKKRRKSMKYVLEDYLDNYVFISSHGYPYYTAKEDIYKKFIKKPKDGSAIRKFRNDTLNPYLKQKGFDFHFRFHDFRATYGMKLLDKCLKILKLQNEAEKSGKSIIGRRMTESIMLMEIRDRMWHSNLSTTEKYLRFNTRYKFKETIRDDFENDIINMLKENIHE